MSSAGDKRFRRLIASLPELERAAAPRGPRRCVFCGWPCRGLLACRACRPLLALDPTYADASGRLDETDYLPEMDEADR